MKTQLDKIDRRILNRIQSDFPITGRPFKAIADELDLDEAQVISRVQHFRDEGVIRRIGANFRPAELGFVSTLCAARVPEADVDAFATVVNAYRGVTHNYLRENEFNVWFTFIAPSMDEIETNLAQISKDTGITDILNLPATHLFKINAQFEL